MESIRKNLEVSRSIIYDYSEVKYGVNWIKIKFWILRFFDLFLVIPTFISAWVLLFVRKAGLEKVPLCRRTLLKVGVMPMINHYYDISFSPDCLSEGVRKLPGIDWNNEEQLKLLESFNYNSELIKIPENFSGDEKMFYYWNGAFEPGDAEYFYNLIRSKKPRRIIEVGSGQSTKLAKLALEANKDDDGGIYKHICIEPYECSWLDDIEVEVIRKKVEDVNESLFVSLEENDILFIDSSHIIHPGGDVLCEVLKILPELRKGVLVHIHDVYSPYDYPSFLYKEAKFWNEQYLLEAFLTNNSQWKVIGALNYLFHNHYSLLKSKCPKLTPEKKVGSFWIQRV